MIITVRKLGPPQQQKLPLGMKETGKYDLAISNIAGATVNIKTSPNLSRGAVAPLYSILYHKFKKKPSHL